MEISIVKLLQRKEQLISGISEKFHISLEGAKEFLKLAIVDWVKTNYKIELYENILSAAPEILHKVEHEVLNWTVNDFDDDDFQVIGYCKNIR